MAAQNMFRARPPAPTARLTSADSEFDCYEHQAAAALPMISFAPARWTDFVPEILARCALIGPPHGTPGTYWRPATRLGLERGLGYAPLVILERVHVFDCGRAKIVAYWAIPWDPRVYFTHPDATVNSGGRVIELCPVFGVDELRVRRDSFGGIRSLEFLDRAVADVFNLLQVLLPGLLALEWEESVLQGRFQFLRQVVSQHMPRPRWIQQELRSVAALQLPDEHWHPLTWYAHLNKNNNARLPVRFMNCFPAREGENAEVARAFPPV